MLSAPTPATIVSPPEPPSTWSAPFVAEEPVVAAVAGDFVYRTLAHHDVVAALGPHRVRFLRPDHAVAAVGARVHYGLGRRRGRERSEVRH